MEQETEEREARSFAVIGENELRILSDFLAARFAEADEPAAGEALTAQALLATKIVDSAIGYLCVTSLRDYPIALQDIKDCREQLERLTRQNLGEKGE